MGAFNWIQFEEICPKCKSQRIVVAQTHVASSYDGSEDRFHDATYRLGEQMRWWEPAHSKYQNWKNGNLKGHEDLSISEEYECCYANCTVCNVDLYAVIKFVCCSPAEVLDFGIESDWPDAYFR